MKNRLIADLWYKTSRFFRFLFEPVISGWMELKEQERLMLIIGASVSVFMLICLSFDLFHNSFHVVVGVAVGVFLGSALIFSKDEILHRRKLQRQRKN